MFKWLAKIHVKYINVKIIIRYFLIKSTCVLFSTQQISIKSSNSKSMYLWSWKFIAWQRSLLRSCYQYRSWLIVKCQYQVENIKLDKMRHGQPLNSLLTLLYPSELNSIINWEINWNPLVSEWLSYSMHMVVSILTFTVKSDLMSSEWSQSKPLLCLSTIWTRVWQKGTLKKRCLLKSWQSWHWSRDKGWDLNLKDKGNWTRYQILKMFRVKYKTKPCSLISKF